MKYILACLLFISSFAYGQECETFDTVRVNAVSLITSNSARVNGSISHIAPGQIVTIILKYVRVGQTDTVSNTGANPLRNLTGLQANTQYIYYYSTICTVGSVSQSVVYTFTTLTSTISYTPQFNNYQYPYIKFDSGMKVPRLPDTSRYRAPSTSGGDILFHRPDSIFYGYNGARWVPFTNSTSGLSNKVDSVTVYGDSLFYWVNGVSYGWILPTQQDISHAGNGLTRHVDTVKLGGALTQTTSITNAGGYDFTLHLNEDNADNGFIGTNYGSFVGMNSGSPMMYQLNGGFIGEIAISSSLGSIISGVSSEIHHRSELFIRPDSVNINPYLGRLSIDTLTNVPGTHALRYNTSTGLVSYSDTTSGGGVTSTDSSFYLSGSGTKINARWWYNVKDFGAKGDGVTSDDAAIQAAIDYAYNDYANNNGASNIYFPNGVYIISNPVLRQPDSIPLRCQICIPFTRWNADSSQFRTMNLVAQSSTNTEIQSVTDFPTPYNGAILKSTWVQTADEPGGNPMSVLGYVGTAETGGFQQLNYTQTYVRDLTVMITTKDSTTNTEIANKMSGIDFRLMANGGLKGDVLIRTTSTPSQQTGPYPASVGYIGPSTANHGNVNNDNLRVAGYFTGAILSEHTSFQTITAAGNYYALEILPYYTVYISHYIQEANAYGLKMQQGSSVTIGAYEAERSGTSWHTAAADITEAGANSSALVSMQTAVINQSGSSANPTIVGDSIHFRLQNDRYGNSYIPLVTNTTVAGIVYNQQRYDTTNKRFQRWTGAAWENIGTANATTAQLNYLSAATGTTGTSSTNLVYSTSPTITTPTFTTGFKIGGAAAANTFPIGDGTNYIPSTLLLPNAATAGRIVFATAANTWGESANLSFDNTTTSLNQTGASFAQYSQIVGTVSNVMGSSTTIGYIGTLSNNSFGVYTNSLERIGVSNAGVITIGDLAGTGSRTVLADASGVLSAPVSDRSAKENIQPLENAISTLMRFRPVTYEYRQGWKRYGVGTQIGFIAQEIQEILPNSTFTTPSTGKMGYNEIDLLPITIKALQEAILRIEALEKEVKRLQK